MNPDLDELLKELEEAGTAHDARGGEHGRKMLNITPDTGRFLTILMRASAARDILEIGTSNGYSTIWLANTAAAIGARITTIDFDTDKVTLAAANFERAGLIDTIRQIIGDAGETLSGLGDASLDFIFLDADRRRYVTWWPNLRRTLRSGGLLVVDNALSHAAEMAPLTALVDADGDFFSSLVPIGKGELVVVKR